MTGLRTLLGTTIGRARRRAVVAAMARRRCSSHPSRRPTPESDADAAITAAWDAGGGATGPLGPKDGGVYPVGAGFGQNFAGGKIFFTPGHRRARHAGRDPRQVPRAGRARRRRPRLPEHRRGRRQGARQSQHDLQRGRQPGDLLDARHRCPRRARCHQRGVGQARRFRRACSACPTDDEVYRGDDVSQTFTGGQLSWNRKTKAFTTTPPELADQLAGLDDSRRRHDGHQRRAPRGGRSAGSAGRRRRRASTPIGADGARAELRGRQDLLQPGHRRQRRDRAGAGQVRERRRSRRATSASRPATRPTAASPR